MAKKEPAPAEPAEAPAPAESVVPAMPVVAQPTEPVGLPTGNPWDLAYPLGHTPPVLKRTGEHVVDDGPGYVGVQVESATNKEQ
jgi:hypothetical protein